MLAQDEAGDEHLVYEGGIEAYKAEEELKIQVITQHFNEDPVKYFGSFAWVTKPWSYEESEKYIEQYELMTAKDVWGRQLLQHLTPEKRERAEDKITQFQREVRMRRA